MPNNKEKRSKNEKLEHASYESLGVEWVSAEHLKKGDIVLLASGEYGTIDNVFIEELDEPETTYNFEVEDYHTYYVGESGVLTHNAGPCGGDALDWDSVVSKTGETRIEHVMKHGAPNPGKATHTVFSGDPISTTNQAWAARAGVSPVLEGSMHVYNVPFAGAGTLGENGVRIVTLVNTNKLVSAYPIFVP